MTILMNTGSECPNEFYIFCNRYNPMTVHNLTVTKTFTSAGYANCSMDSEFFKKYLDGSATYLPFLPAKPDCNIVSPYCLTAMNDYRIEYDAEVCRKTYYPKYPSRLSAVYAFGDFESCEKVSKKWNWDISTVKKFKLIENTLTRVIKVNMEIISLARYAYRVSFSDANELNKLWRHYWSGGGNICMELPDANFARKRYDSEEIFEYLIEGDVVLID